jgi:hypothetical protein
MMITEIRIYKLKPGKAGEYNALFIEQSLPMMKRWNVNIVDYGFSLEEEHDFYLIRNYQSLEERQQSQDAFYGSDEWTKGPREAILSCIESYNTAVIDTNKLTAISRSTN